jgi:hypothetical protein
MLPFIVFVLAYKEASQFVVFAPSKSVELKSSDDVAVKPAPPKLIPPLGGIAPEL